MTDKNAESMKHLNEGERIAILSDKLVEAFGSDACDVIERQIEGHDSDETRATWIAVWETLCAPEARRA